MNQRKILTLFLITVFLISSNQPILSSKFKNESSPVSATVYRVYLSLVSDYYILDNIKVRVYDDTTQAWNWCDPHEIIVQNTSYMLKIYDKATNQVLFWDTEPQTRSDNYRVIPIDAIKIVNNSPDPIMFQTDPSTFSNLYEYPDGNLAWADYDGSSYDYEDYSSSLLANGYNFEMPYVTMLNPAGSTYDKTRFLDLNSGDSNVYEFALWFEGSSFVPFPIFGTYPYISICDNNLADRVLMIFFDGTDLGVFDGDSTTASYDTLSYTLKTFAKIRVEIDASHYDLYLNDVLEIENGNVDTETVSAISAPGCKYIDFGTYNYDMYFARDVDKFYNLTLDAYETKYLGIDRAGNFQNIEYNIIDFEDHILQNGNLTSSTSVVRYNYDDTQTDELILINNSPEPIIFNVWNRYDGGSQLLYPNGDKSLFFGFYLWDSTAANAYSVIDDDGITADYVDSDGGDGFEACGVNFDTFTLGDKIVSNVELQMNLESGMDYILVNVVTSSVILSESINALTPGWYYFDGDQSLDQSEIDALSVNFYTYGAHPDNIIVYSLRLNISYIIESSSYLTALTSVSVQINPYSTTRITNNSYYYYSVEDLYGNILETQSILQSTTNYTEDYQDPCQLAFTDQNNQFLNFNAFLVYVNSILITTPTFYADRYSTVSITVCNSANTTITTENHYIEKGVNYITLTINMLYLQNNAPEPVNMSLVENGHYQGAYSWDLDTPNTRPSNIDYSNEGLMYLENEDGGHNKNIVLNSSYSMQYGTDEIQFDSSLTGWTNGDGTNCSSQFLQSKTLNSKPISNVVQQFDNSSTVNAQIWDISADGLVFSWWQAVSSVSVNSLFFRFYENGVQRTRIYITATAILVGYEDGGTDETLLTGIQANIWYHIAIVFTPNDKTTSFYVNGELVKTWEIFSAVVESIDNFRIETYTLGSNYYQYTASVYQGFSLSEAFLSLNNSAYITFNTTQESYAQEFDSGLTGWTDSDGTGCESTYVSSKTFSEQRIDNVLQQADSSANRAQLMKSDSYLITSGWYATNDTNKIIYLAETYEVVRVCYYYTSGGYFRNSAGIAKLAFLPNTWYHYIISINPITDKSQLWINGQYISEDALSVSMSTVCDKIAIETHPTEANLMVYHSDIYTGFSFDEALASFHANESIEWWQKTDQNFALLIDSNYIQLDDSETTRDYKKFNDLFDITGVEQWGTIEDPDYSFIDLSMMGINATASIIDLDSHENVLKLTRTLSGGVFRSAFIRPSTTNDYLEMWVGSEAIHSTGYYIVSSGNSLTNSYKLGCVYLTGNQIRFYYGDGGSGVSYTLAGTQVANKLNHIKIYCDTTTHKISFWLNGVNIVDNSPFMYGNLLNSFNAVVVTSESTAAYSCYVDAIGFNSYTIGDNNYSLSLPTYWEHYELLCNGFSTTLYQDSTRIVSFDRNTLLLDSISFIASDNDTVKIDAVDYSWANGYIHNRNQELNSSEEVWCWEAFPEWNSGYYTGVEDNLNEWVNTSGTSCTVSTVNLGNHHEIMKLDDQNTGSACILYYPFIAQISGTLEYVIYKSDSNTNYVHLLDSTSTRIYMFFTSYLGYNDGTSHNLVSISSNTWYHVRVDYDCTVDTFNLYLNGSLIGENLAFQSASTTLSRVYVQTMTTATNQQVYLDCMYISSEMNYFPWVSLLENTTYSPLSMDLNYSQLVYPYSQELIVDYTSDEYLVGITDLYDNVLDVQGITSSENQIVYTPAEMRECMISLANQRGDYLNWENYRIYIDNAQIYSNTFYAEISEIVNVSIYTRYNKYLTSVLHTVARDANYIPLSITQFSLKIYNQQEKFIYSNLTFDPVYDDSDQYWSEWLAPGEIATYYLSENHYLINITEYETTSTTIYSYYLNGDDVLLITSSNTLDNILQNIENVNTTIGNQITNVEINLSNQNSAINNTIIEIYINLNNTNSSITNLLINQETTINNILSNLSVVLVNQVNSFSFINDTLETVVLNQENSFSFLNSTLSSLLALSQNTFTYLNSTTGALYIMSEDSFYFLNSSVVNMINTLTTNFNFINSTMGLLQAMSLQSFSYLNSTLDDVQISIANNFTYTNSLINQNQIDILTQFAIVNSNITNNSIEMLNKLITVNSTISNLVATLASNVLLVNNSIYTASLNITTMLELLSNNIAGNFTITFTQNEFLTEIFKQTMFGDLLYENLNWSSIGYNYSLVNDFIDEVSFLNNYRNETLEILIRYQDHIETLQIAALETILKLLPSSGVDYRIRSITSGEYMSDWEAIPSNKTIKLGFYEETIPATPEQVQLEIKDYLMIALFAVVSLAVVSVLYIKTQSNLKPSEMKTTRRKIGVRDTSIFGSNDFMPTKKTEKGSQRAVLVVAIIVIIVFILSYFLV